MKKEYLNEIWRPVVGYEGLYEVSSFGRVKNCFGKFLALHSIQSGYLRVSLCKNCKTKHHLVHRLVAIAFIPNPNNYPEVNHKDEDKTNNSIQNLEWCDRLYNNRYGQVGAKRSKSLKNPIIVFSPEHKLGMYFESATDAASYFNVSRQAIYHALKHYRGKKTCCGHRWEYA